MSTSLKVRLLIYSFMISMCYIFVDKSVAAYFSAIIFLVETTNNRQVSVFLWISLSNIIYHTDVIIFGVITILLLFVLYSNHFLKNRYLDIKLLGFSFTFISVIFISYFNGINSDAISAFFMISNLLLLLIIVSDKSKVHTLNNYFFSFFISSLIILLISYTEFLLSPAGVLDFGRLVFDENVRHLANIVVIPTFILSYSIISQKDIFVNSKKVNLFLLTIYLITLLLTVSKGALFAYIAGLIVMLISSKNIKKTILFSFFIFSIFILILITFDSIDFGRFLERNYDLNGRFRIWYFYYLKVLEFGNFAYLFGVGPGNVTRIAMGDYMGIYYAHSVIIDYFYTTGFIGFVLFLSLFTTVFIKSVLAKNHFVKGLLVMSFLLYLTHGASTNTSIYIVLALSLKCLNNINYFEAS